MFCPKCGNQIPDGSTFCPVCGATFTQAAPMRGPEAQPYQEAAPQYQQPVYQQPIYQQPAYQQPQQPYYGGYNPGAAQQERMANMQEMDHLRGYFSQKTAEYDEYDMINATLDEYDKRRPGLLVWGIILFTIGLIAIISLIANEVDIFEEPGAAVGLIVWMLGSVGMILAFVFGTIARNKNKQAAVTRLVELTDELHTFFLNYGYCPVGEEFTNPAILGRIGDNLRSGRANNIQEAINIMFDDAHKSQMEYAAMETMHSARQAAAGATTTAVFAAASFFLK